jgi:dipeptidyl peptidase IV (DPP IV)-like protein/prolyl oligopeptidase family protein
MDDQAGRDASEPRNQMKHFSVSVVNLLFPAIAFAQGTAADYERSANLRRLTQNKVSRERVEATWLADKHRAWYRVDLAGGGREYVVVDAEKRAKEPLFDHTKLAAALSKILGKEEKADRLALDNFTVSDDGATLRFRAGLKSWNYQVASGELKEVESVPAAPGGNQRNPRPAGGPPRRNTTSPDGNWTIVIIDNNLVLRSKDDKQDTQLTTDGTKDDAYQPNVVWSPDSKKVVGLKTKAGDSRVVTIVDSSPRDQLQPKVITYPYLKPGDNIPLTKPHLFDVDAKKEIPISDALFPNPWSIDEVRWRPDSAEFMFRYNQRGHQVLRIVGVSAATGEARAIVDEQSKTFIDYATKSGVHFVSGNDELIWMSERDGWCHLYLYDTTAGAVKNQITRGEWVIRNIVRFDDAARQIWFYAGGIVPAQDPYHRHYCRINYDGSGLIVLTEGDGDHVVRSSSDNNYLVDTYSRVDQPPITNLRSASDGKLICELERADWSALLAAGWKPPERFVAKGRDGTTDIFGVIIKPTTFDPAKKYPVIETIYAGPQGAFVPKSFQSYLGMQSIAELGFILVQIDGMGTSQRSKAFHDVCCKNLGDAGFPDRILWMKAAAETRPWMDLSHVGIYGGSAGGQNTLGGLLTHPEFYHVGVADCGCHDNRMDKIWWNELWMGWPIGPHYAEQSNVTLAPKLQGKLMLTVGELDRNVDPASTMQVVNALIKANKDFDFIIVPGGGHGSGESPYAARRRQDFFVRNLLGVEPRR